MTGPRVLAATLRLRASLDEVAAALAWPDAAALLAAESRLAAALIELGSVRTVAPADRSGIAIELIRARAALARCRVLGAAAGDVSALALAAQGRATGYNRNGATAPRGAMRGSGLKARL